MGTQLDRDKAYRARQKKLGFAKMAFMFPIAYKHDLELYVARKKKKWEKARDGK